MGVGRRRKGKAEYDVIIIEKITVTIVFKKKLAMKRANETRFIRSDTQAHS